VKTNLRSLPKFRDGLSFLYVEHAVVEREAQSVAVFSAAGRVSVPAAGLGTLLLGPGTRITHAAMGALADCGCSVAWVGEGAMRCYAVGTGKSRSNRNLEAQARAFADAGLHLAVVRRMYQLRFSEVVSASLTLQQIRGKEGVRVREAYAAAAQEYGVAWTGRNYDPGSWSKADPVNRALSAGNACLYGVCQAGIHSAGFSTGLGFIHVGKQLSFVYDVADLYKTSVVIPAAFQAAGEPKPETAVRRLVRDRIVHENLLSRLLADLEWIFDLRGAEDADADVVDNSPGELWDVTRLITGGQQHAGDADDGA